MIGTSQGSFGTPTFPRNPAAAGRRNFRNHFVEEFILADSEDHIVIGMTLRGDGLAPPTIFAGLASVLAATVRSLAH
jgi:hypothetical protein